MQTKPLEILRKRVDFLACNRGRRQPMPGFVLLVRDRKDDNPAIRIGITVTKKIGGAVVRNRMKRRFRALAREILAHKGIDGADHVLIGRSGGIERDFASLTKELEKALRRIQAPEGTDQRTSGPRPHRPKHPGDASAPKSHAHKGRGKGGKQQPSAAQSGPDTPTHKADQQ